MLCLIHELLSNEGQIPGKQELNQMYYLALIPLLHSTFFTLTQISPQAINEIYHWHKLGRGGKEARKDEGKRRMKTELQRGGGLGHCCIIDTVTKSWHMPFPMNLFAV